MPKTTTSRGTETRKRLFHITNHKCGSQWVRDVLTAPEILRGNHLQHVAHPPDLGNPDGWKSLPQNSIYSPVYWINALEWCALREPGDHAIVVIRDPRDVIVSLMYSWLYSHANTPFVDVVRDTLFSSESTDARLARVLVYGGRLWQRFFYSWTEFRSTDVLVVRYEDLVADQEATFGSILTWLGWEWQRATLASVVERFSFERRSGRQPGVADPMSHYRRGIAGDWREHFTRELGGLWESLAPGLLARTGYEQSDDWWHQLPPLSEVQAENACSVEEERLAAQSHRISVLEQELKDKERVIHELVTACDERLAVIQQLDSALKTATANNQP